MLCVNTKVLNPNVLNTVLPVDDPGATCSLLPGAAESVFLTEIVSKPVLLTDAVTLGTVLLIAEAKLATVPAEGTATSVLFIRKV